MRSTNLISASSALGASRPKLSKHTHAGRAEAFPFPGYIRDLPARTYGPPSCDNPTLSRCSPTENHPINAEPRREPLCRFAIPAQSNNAELKPPTYSLRRHNLLPGHRAKAASLYHGAAWDRTTIALCPSRPSAMVVPYSSDPQGQSAVRARQHAPASCGPRVTNNTPMLNPRIPRPSSRSFLSGSRSPAPPQDHRLNSQSLPTAITKGSETPNSVQALHLTGSPGE